MTASTRARPSSATRSERAIDALPTPGTIVRTVDLERWFATSPSPGDEAVLTRYGPFCGPGLAGAGATRLSGGDPRTARDRRGDRVVGRRRWRQRPLTRPGPHRPRRPTRGGIAPPG